MGNKRKTGNMPVPGPGRNSGYDVSMNDMAHKLALLGLTNVEMAEFFGVSEQTIYNHCRVNLILSI